MTGPGPSDATSDEEWDDFYAIPNDIKEKNKQEQDDEIIALQAIFGNDFLWILPEFQLASETESLPGPSSHRAGETSGANAGMLQDSTLKIFQVNVSIGMPQGVVVCMPPSPAFAGNPSSSTPVANGAPPHGASAQKPSTKASVTPPTLGAAARSGAASSSNNTTVTPSSSQPSPAATPFLKVAHLPPLVLTVATHPGYPSGGPPRFTLSAPFLSSRSASRLCGELDALWAETSEGSAVVYTWVDHMERSVAATLAEARDLWLVRETHGGAEACRGDGAESGKDGAGTDDLRQAAQGASGMLFLRSDSNDARAHEGGCHGASCAEGVCEYGGAARDARVSAWCWDAERCLLEVLRHDERRKLAEFLSAEHLCGVCFETKPGHHFTRLPGCRHAFCTPCLRQLASVAVTDGALAQCRCPESGCRAAFPPCTLKELLDPTQFARWEELTLQRSLDVMADFVYCPRCKAGTIEDGDHLAQCGRCFFTFCGLCREKWHRGSECLTAEVRLQILQERAAGRRAAAEQLTEAEKAMKNELLALSYVEREAKRCPACGMAIIKTEGCNKMTCSNCNAYFCYICGQQVEGYDHYKDSCALFDEETVRRWNLQMQGDPAGWAPAQEDPGDARGWRGGHMVRAAMVKFCPNCRQLNFKEGGNNHIRCWACTKHFCAQCSCMVKNTAQHYGKGRCKQHSA